MEPVIKLLRSGRSPRNWRKQDWKIAAELLADENPPTGIIRSRRWSGIRGQLREAILKVEVRTPKRRGRPTKYDPERWVKSLELARSKVAKQRGVPESKVRDVDIARMVARHIMAAGVQVLPGRQTEEKLTKFWTDRIKQTKFQYRKRISRLETMPE